MDFAMTTFHFVRRFLACSILGVTAFGVSGWLMRPKLNWELDCTDWGGTVSVANPNRECSDREPVWMEALDVLGVNKSVAAIDPTAGRVIQRWPLTYEESRHPIYITGDGDLIATCSGKFQSTKFRLLDGRTNNAPIERDLPGYWQPIPIGSTVWNVEAQRGAWFVLKIADVKSGAIETHVVKAPDPDYLRRPSARDLSPDGKRFVALEPVKEEQVAFEAIQIWDVESKTMLDRVELPLLKHLLRRRIGRLSWVDGGRRIEIEGTMWFEKDPEAKRLHFVFDPESKRFFDGDWLPAKLDRVTPDSAFELLENDGPLRIWTDWTKDEKSVFMLTQNRRTILPWQRFLIDDGGRDWNLGHAHPFAYVLPKSNALLFLSRESSLWSLLPSSIQECITANGGHGEDRIRWHDWKLHEWRDVGCAGDVEGIQIRPNAMMAVMKTDAGARTLLQSWPLPPRDPKWPAAATGVLSFLGLWWALKKRSAPLRVAANAELFSDR